MTDDLADDLGARPSSSGVVAGTPADSGPADEGPANGITAGEDTDTEFTSAPAAGEATSELVEPGLLEELATNLLWRIGRVSDDGPVTVRVGLASSAGLFQDLPRLRSASDAEVEAAIEDGSVRVEWVGARPRTER